MDLTGGRIIGGEHRAVEEIHYQESTFARKDTLGKFNIHKELILGVEPQLFLEMLSFVMLEDCCRNRVFRLENPVA